VTVFRVVVVVRTVRLVGITLMKLHPYCCR
jgi:hypothetical protein